MNMLNVIDVVNNTIHSLRLAQAFHVASLDCDEQTGWKMLGTILHQK